VEDPQPYIIRWFRAETPAQAQVAGERDCQEYLRAGYLPIVQRWISLGEIGAYTGWAVFWSLPFQSGGVLIVTLAYRPDVTGNPTATLREIDVRPGFGPN
jgi:hypothetical protein